MVLKGTEEDLISRLEQITTISLGKLLTKPPSSEVSITGFGILNSCLVAQAAHVITILKDKIRKLPCKQPVIFTDS